MALKGEVGVALGALGAVFVGGLIFWASAVSVRRKRHQEAVLAEIRGRELTRLPPSTSSFGSSAGLISHAA